MKLNKLASCLVLLLAASSCLAQMYTVTDIGFVYHAGTEDRIGINASGQVASYGAGGIYHAFRTAPNSPFNPATDDLGTLGGCCSLGYGINNSGQVVGISMIDAEIFHAFRTAPNAPITSTSDLGVGSASDINASGQVVGASGTVDCQTHAFRTAANSTINMATDDLGTLGGTYSIASGINDSGQVAGVSSTSIGEYHAFRTAANAKINGATDDIGNLAGAYSTAWGINDVGQVVGVFAGPTTGVYEHAFRTAPNAAINPATDDLGTPGPLYLASVVSAINNYGQVVGTTILCPLGTCVKHPSPSRAFIYDGGIMHDLNDLVASDSGLGTLEMAVGINDAGQIVGYAMPPLEGFPIHEILLNPIYKASVQQPINADGSSVFKANRGVIPVKFAVTQSNSTSCTLPATIAISRAGGGTLAAVDESTYSTQANNGSNFRVDPNACQYIYNLAASSLGVGTYRVDISVNGIMVGHAVFALK
jgi:probable HAF family extracellular repeat protein